MSDTRINKENMKFMKGLIDKVSNTLQRKWDRHNFENGKFKNKRNKKRYENDSEFNNFVDYY